MKQKLQTIIMFLLLVCYAYEGRAQTDTIIQMDFTQLKVSKKTRQQILDACKEFTAQSTLKTLYTSRNFDTMCTQGMYERGDSLRIVIHIHTHGFAEGTTTTTYVSIISKKWLIVYTPGRGRNKRLSIDGPAQLKRGQVIGHLLKTLPTITPDKCKFTPIHHQLHSWRFETAQNGLSINVLS